MAKAVIVGLLAVASGLVVAQDTPAVTAAKRVACGPDEVKFDAKQGVGSSAPSEAPESGKALVYLLATQGECVACEATLRYGVDGRWVGATKGTSWIAVQVSPGEHYVCAAWQARQEALARHVELQDLSVEPGKVYFLRARVLYSRSIQEIFFEPVGEKQGRILLALSSPAEWKKK